MASSTTSTTGHPPPEPDDDTYLDEDDVEHLQLVHLRELLVAGAEWRARAACRGEDTSYWFPARGEDLHVPRAICRQCPVADPCLEYALDAGEHFGVWGGASERERRRLRRARREQGDLT